jgi:hypothetical protein
MEAEVSSGRPAADHAPLGDEGARLHASLAAIQNEMARESPSIVFSPAALQRLEELQVRYVEDLAIEAVRAARRADNDQVQAVNVQSAGQIVRIDARPAQGALQAFGGALWGLGATLLATDLLADKQHIALILGSVTGLVIATVILMGTVDVTRLRLLRAGWPSALLRRNK